MMDDLRLAFRSLRRSPGFAAVAILILGLGIGANTALFGALQATVLRTLPYPQPERLVELATSSLKSGATFNTSWQDYQDWMRQSRSFTGLAAYAWGPSNMVGSAEPVQIQGALATRNYFSILGVQARLGRTFSPTPRTPEAVISSRLWAREFGSSGAVLGKHVVLAGAPVTIVGVLPPGDGLPSDVEAWIPADLEPDTADRSGHNWPGIIGRLQPGVTLAAVKAEMSGIAARLAQRYPNSNRGEGISVTSLQANLAGDSGTLLGLLLGAAGLVLLIACANLASLYMIRATTRQREAALRLALGASRWRLARQWIVEGLVVAGAGAAVGLWLAQLASGFIAYFVPATLPGATAVMNWQVALFAALLALVTAGMFAAAPALQALPGGLIEALKQGGAQAGGGRSHARTRQVLVVAEIALAMVVLAGAGLLLRSLGRMQSLALGFQPAHRVVAEVDFDSNPQPQWLTILARLRANPEFHEVSAVTNLPFLPDVQEGDFEIAGRPVKPNPYAWYHVASPGYFQAMGIPLLQGRDFDDHDTAAAPGVAIVDQATAHLYWPSQNPIGARLRFFGFDDKPQWLTVIGVVGSTQQGSLRAQPHQQIYTCAAQHTAALYGMNIVAVGSGDLGPAIRSVVHKVNPDLPVEMTSMPTLLGSATATPRFRTQLMGAFAALAWILAALGIYGLVAQDVLRRRSEIGIRMALGAAPGSVVAQFLGRGVILALAGTAAGLLLAFVITRVLSSFLFETSAADPAVFGLGAAALLVTAVAACYFPARRASRVHPAECLRVE